MIKTLRRRLTLLVACVLALVTAGIVLAIHGVNLRNIDSSARAALAARSASALAFFLASKALNTWAISVMKQISMASPRNTTTRPMAATCRP